MLLIPELICEITEYCSGPPIHSVQLGMQQSMLHNASSTLIPRCSYTNELCTFRDDDSSPVNLGKDFASRLCVWTETVCILELFVGLQISGVLESTEYMTTRLLAPLQLAPSPAKYKSQTIKMLSTRYTLQGTLIL